MNGIAPRMGAGLLISAIVFALMTARADAADRLIKPFLGVTFGGGTSFVDLEDASGKANPALGASAAVLGDMFGIEIEVADAPGFFQAGDKHLVLSSRVTSFMGNVVVAVPRRVAEYSLRPYFVGGGGLIRVRLDDYFGAFQVASVLPTFDIGAGVLGFFNSRLGVCWEIRRFESLSKETQNPGTTLTGDEQLSFWRASMGLVIRY